MILLAPVYQPGHHLVTFVTGMRDAAPEVRVVVVDDGSGPASAAVLDGARALGCTVLRHAGNLGKGAALKTGFRHAIEAHPGHDVVCADPDGQHRAADVLRVAEHVRVSGRMVLGVREFTGEVPLRSRFGNSLTSKLFAAATGRPVRDTQTGLRGYPSAMLERLCAIPGERFEYEMNVLLEAARAGRPIEQTVIATTYLDGATSHFGSLSDSARVYWPLIRFAAASMLTVARPGR